MQHLLCRLVRLAQQHMTIWVSIDRLRSILVPLDHGSVGDLIVAHSKDAVALLSRLSTLATIRPAAHFSTDLSFT